MKFISESGAHDALKGAVELLEEVQVVPSNICKGSLSSIHALKHDKADVVVQRVEI